MDNKEFAFLQGGGTMGSLIRSFQWSETNLASPENWPVSLKVTLSNLLRSKFPTFLWWGKERIQFYNDACCHSLIANSKHPLALGQAADECWKEAWHLIGPLAEQVENNGEPTWTSNKRLVVNRGGVQVEAYWTFSFSSILDDSGQNGGILITCIETTNEMNAGRQLEQNQSRLQVALKAGQLGEWELDLATYELNASANCKFNFGQPVEQQFSYDTLIQSIHPDDQDYQEKKVIEAIINRKDLNIEYRVIWPDSTIHWVHIRGLVQYSETDVPTRIVGTSIDITEKKQYELLLQTALEQVRLSKEAAELGTFDLDLEAGSMHWDDRCRILF
ncbi:MAG: hypothetical protein EOO94_04930, partial [Pedobacter sp.]